MDRTRLGTARAPKRPCSCARTAQEHAPTSFSRSGHHLRRSALAGGATGRLRSTRTGLSYPADLRMLLAKTDSAPRTIPRTLDGSTTVCLQGEALRNSSLSSTGLRRNSGRRWRTRRSRVPILRRTRGLLLGLRAFYIRWRDGSKEEGEEEVRTAGAMRQQHTFYQRN
jgi:hypothetical protein